MVSSVKLGSSNSLPLAERFWEHPGALGKPSKLKPPRWRGRISRPSKLVAHRLKVHTFLHTEKSRFSQTPGLAADHLPSCFFGYHALGCVGQLGRPLSSWSGGPCLLFFPCLLHEYLSRRSSDSIVTRPSGRPPTIDK
ncbi:hypothetical protein CABS03_11185 [Colletotrichum abscissum]|uniref:Uncharacterized protein n=1 Tax=Colletotrichum abscissum TaxID=1671311 RepID=A0A9P9X8H0_9PEZI|nr:hypothetical protein CABS02_10254 [Colletotrichum abscissum]